MGKTYLRFVQKSRLLSLIYFCFGAIICVGISHAQGEPQEPKVPKSDSSNVQAVDQTQDLNRPPFLATYYIQPKVEAGKEITIDYYVTDYDQREYRKNDQIIAFTVDYWVNGSKTTLSKVKAGDNSITLNALPKGEVLFALQATDAQGRKSHRIFQQFLVVDAAENVIPENKILKPDLKKFGIYNDDTHPAETSQGLTKMLKWASDNGYLKVILPEGDYRLDENKAVQMATNLTLDMNGATFKLNPNAKDKCLMLEFINCTDSHVMNGTFVGDLDQHNYAKAPNQSAWVDGISISQGSKYCTVENVTVKDITGRGVITNHGAPAAEPKKILGFVSGDIDDKGQNVPSEARMTTKEFLDIADNMKTFGFIQLGDPLKSQGTPVENWVYRAHFFDASKGYMETIEGYFYGRLYPPTNAAYAKFTIYSKTEPNSLFVFNIQSPYNCSFTSINHQDTRSAGMALNGYENLLVENCKFTNCGKELAKSAFLAADGLNLMRNLTLRNNTFASNPHVDVTVNAGHNSVIEGNIGKIDMAAPANSFVLRNNKKLQPFAPPPGQKLSAVIAACKTIILQRISILAMQRTARKTGNWFLKNVPLKGMGMVRVPRCCIVHLQPPFYRIAKSLAGHSVSAIIQIAIFVTCMDTIKVRDTGVALLKGFPGISEEASTWKTVWLRIGIAARLQKRAIQW